jgi:hypothetical protein
MYVPRSLHHLHTGYTSLNQFDMQGPALHTIRFFSQGILLTNKLMLGFLIDNIFVVFGKKKIQQTIEIPMSTNCAPLLAY